MPRDHEAIADKTNKMIEKIRVRCKPFINGPDMSDGKNVLPVKYETFAAGNAAKALAGTKCEIGLYPKNAANKLETGGVMEICVARLVEIFCATKPVFNVCGRVDESPKIIRLKNMPIESTMPEFVKVARMPDAWPRSFAGTEFMMAALFGAAKSPNAVPIKKSKTANGTYEKSAGNKNKPPKHSAAKIMPPVEK